jgi:N-acyl homoserine lactone hydrolase
LANQKLRPQPCKWKSNYPGSSPGWPTTVGRISYLSDRVSDGDGAPLGHYCLLRVKTKIPLLLVTGLLAALGWTFVKRPLPVPKAMGPVLPQTASIDGVSFSVIRGAGMQSQEGFSVRGGSLTKSFITGIVAFVVEHPQGRLLIDAGVARDVQDHFETIPWLMRALASLTVKQPTVDALAARGIKPGDLRAIVLTHSHWDHVSGLADLREVPVWITAEELAHARADDEGGKLYRQLEAQGPLRLHDLIFDGGAYGPFAASHDFFGDGSVVLVPMPGHTPGSVGVFVNLPAGKRCLIIGDTSWTKEGVDWPAEKPWLARRMVDFDAAVVREQLVLLHQLQRANPDLIIVPAHDPRVHETIPAFAATEP